MRCIFITDFQYCSCFDISFPFCVAVRSLGDDVVPRVTRVTSVDVPLLRAHIIDKRNL